MKKEIIIVLLSCIVFVSFSQTTITIQPDAETGKDAYIHDLDINQNLGNHPDLAGIAWKCSGQPCNARGLIEFDLSVIPPNSVIISALLSLSHSTSNNNTGHSTINGSNESVLRRVISSWDENFVTWTNQPNTTTQNEVILAQSTTQNQDYPNINVTSLIQDIIDNPLTSYGLMIKLQTEIHYRSLLFASSDQQDPNKHPKLEITYTNNSGINDNKGLLDLVEIYPNPTDDLLFIKFNQVKDKSVLVNIIDSKGKLVFNTLLKSTIEAPFKIHLKNYPAGVYFIKIQGETFIRNKKVIVY